MLGNILIVISLLSYSLLAIFLSKPMPGGDYGVGYAFVFMAYGVFFVISTGLLAWYMNANHCFDWVMRYRNLIVFVCWAALVTMTFWSLEYHRSFIILHLLIFCLCIYLINDQQSGSYPHTWAKMAMRVCVVTSLVISLISWGASAKYPLLKEVQKINWAIKPLLNYQSDYKATIDKIINFNDTSVIGLLEYAHPEMNKNIREKAIAKIKSYSNLEEQLISTLIDEGLATVWAYNDDSYYVYPYLEGNRVEHPEKFIGPIKYSLKVFATRAANDMNDPYKRELWGLNLESFCRALEFQFKDYAKEFKPGMLNLQNVLAVEYPERIAKEKINRYNKTVKAYRKAVKNWLDANP